MTSLAACAGRGLRRNLLQALGKRGKRSPDAPISEELTMRAFFLALVFAWRSLRRSPVFAGTATLTLAIGIAAAAGMLTVTNAVLVRPLPFPESHRLLGVWQDPERKRLKS